MQPVITITISITTITTIIYAAPLNKPVFASCICRAARHCVGHWKTTRHQNCLLCSA